MPQPDLVAVPAPRTPLPLLRRHAVQIREIPAISDHLSPWHLTRSRFFTARGARNHARLHRCTPNHTGVRYDARPVRLETA